MTVPEEWLERSQYDIENARIMFDRGRHVSVLFFCQQAVEKALKAIIVERTLKLPPRIHNLVKLAEKAGVVADENRGDLMRALNEYYVDSRYPEISGGSSEGVDQALAKECLRDTEDLLQWLTTFRKT